jgi:hypothetical protein
MPKVGQAPAVIPIPELSEREQQDRLQEVDQVSKRHALIREKIAKLTPAFDEIIQEHLKLLHDLETSAPLRALHVGRRLGIQASLKGVAGVKFFLSQLVKQSERSVRHIEAAKREVLDPNLPGVTRDPLEVREQLRKMAKATKAAEAKRQAG